MATSTTELILKFSGDPRSLKQTMAQVRAELSQTTKAQVSATQTANKQITAEAKAQTRALENEEKARAKAAEQLQKQRSAALISIWRAELRERERIAKAEERAASGQKPFGEILQGLTQSLTTLQGPMSGTASRVSSLSSQFSTLSAESAAAGTSIAGMAGPLGLAAAGIAATAVAVGGLTAGLFDLAKQTAEFQGNLFDMSQQIGVSVETLSALEVLARTTGGSIETVVASLGIFQRNLESSHDPTSKEAALLKELGVTATDTEEALRQTLKGLFALGEGSKQTNASLELFGRGGRFINAILKESHGNLDEAIKRFRELGIVVSTEDARAADEFNDTLATLQFQLRAVTAVVGKEVIPQALSALRDLQKAVKDNKDAIESLGLAAKVTAGLIGLPLRGALFLFTEKLKEQRPFLLAIVELYERMAAAVQGVAGKVPNVAPNAIPAQPIPTDVGPGPFVGGDVGGGAGLFRKKQSAVTAAARTVESVDAFEEALKSLGRVTAEIDREISELEEKHERARRTALDNLNGFIRQQAEALSAAKGERRTAFDDVEDLINSIGLLGEALDATEVSWLKFNAALIEAHETAKKLAETATQNLIPAITVEGPEAGGQILSDEAIDALGRVPDEIGLMERAMGSLQDRMIEFSDFASGAFIGSLHGIVDALGEGLAAWALYGVSFAKAMRQSLAALGAKIAAEALMQAAIHAAYAIGSLAFGDFAGAAQHGLAAAKFAAIAAGAGLASRAIAGNSFGRESAGFSGGSAGVRGSASRSSGPTPIDIGRNVSQPVQPIVHVHIHGEAGAAFDFKVVKTMIENVRSNGEFRGVITSEMAAA